VIVSRIAGRAGTVSAAPCGAKGTWLVALDGEHDQSTALQLDQIRSIWPFCKAVVVDLGSADFIDSSVIRWLLQGQRELAAADAHMSVVLGPRDSPASCLFGLLRMSAVLPCYATREEALSAVPSV
jgi:anti-anti-sigma regulatory factor